MKNNLINFISDSLGLEYEVNVVTDGDSQTLVLYDGLRRIQLSEKMLLRTYSKRLRSTITDIKRRIDG